MVPPCIVYTLYYNISATVNKRFNILENIFFIKLGLILVNQSGNSIHIIP